MSWFKNPWESANPWAEEKPEFKKAVGTAVDTDEQTAPAVVVDAIKYSSDFDGVMGVEMRKIIAETEYYKKYLTALNGTTEYDTYVFTWTNLQTNTDESVSSAVNFSKDGFTAPEGGSTAQTLLISDEQEFKSLTSSIADVNTSFRLKSVKISDLKGSFDLKKKVILIVIVKQYLNPYQYVLDKTHFAAMKKANDAKDPAGIAEYYKWWDNAKLEFTHTLIHELIAHGIHHIKGDKKDAKTEHQNYHGIYATTSPDVRDVLDNVKDYKETIMLKAIREIQSSIQKLYYGGK